MRPIIILLIIVISSNCQFPVDNSTLPDAKQFLVIDAELTPNYSKINVTYSLEEVTNQGGYLFPKPPKAIAYITDNKGRSFQFKKTDGSIDTTFKGEIGLTYRLFVEVNDQKYESKPETMAFCPEIDSVSANYRRENFRVPSDLFYDGFDVYSFTKDEPSKENFYQWDWIHYEHAAFCNVRFNQSQNRDELIPCNTDDCWNIIYNKQTIVGSDKLRDGKSLANRIVRVPFSIPPTKYYLKVIQRAITPSVYAYYQSIQIQTQSTGTLFDIPAQTQFNPNVYNVNNNKEHILGVFNVYSSRHKIIYIDMEQKIPNATYKFIWNGIPFTTISMLQAPCIESDFRTKIKPEGWVE